MRILLGRLNSVKKEDGNALLLWSAQSLLAPLKAAAELPHSKEAWISCSFSKIPAWLNGANGDRRHLHHLH
jgi:hypothetical protein